MLTIFERRKSVYVWNTSVWCVSVLQVRRRKDWFQVVSRRPKCLNRRHRRRKKLRRWLNWRFFQLRRRPRRCSNEKPSIFRNTKLGETLSNSNNLSRALVHRRPTSSQSAISCLIFPRRPPIWLPINFPYLQFKISPMRSAIASKTRKVEIWGENRPVIIW